MDYREQGGIADDRPRADDGGGAIDELLAVITQEQIREFLHLQDQHNQFEHLKARLKAALASGAAVEPGPWRLELELREQRALTAAALIKALGVSEAEVQRLKASTPPQVLRYLAVRPDPGGR